MQGQYDQMFLFERWSEGLFDDMILIGLCIHAIVRWKCDEQQLKAERQNVVVYLEQERLFQEQLKDDIMERCRLDQVNTGLKLKCGNKVEGGTSETSYNDHCAKTEGHRSAYRSVLALVHDGSVPLDDMCT
jgi:hypothetical protein